MNRKLICQQCGHNIEVCGDATCDDMNIPTVKESDLWEILNKEYGSIPLLIDYLKSKGINVEQ